jgi:hypothetical protein
VLSSGAWLPLVHPGFLNTRAGGDSPFLLVRLDQLLRNLRAGVFPVRWMPDAAYGLGYPFFNYYAALPYYVAAGLVLGGWGPIAALKITQAIGFLASGAAMYALGRHAFRRRASALLAAVAYVYAPFHLVNVYVRGDSLSEFYAFVWMPVVGWALLRLRERASAGHVLLLGGAYAALILTHNISALIATPVAIATALFLLLVRRGRPSRARFLLAGLAGGLLGLGLSSWFWLPAFLERDLVQLQGMTSGYFHFSGHFRGMDLLQFRWIFDYTMGEDGNPFSMGLMQAVLTLLGSMTLIRGIMCNGVRRRDVLQGAFVLTMFLIITWCIMPLSRPLWEHVPLLPLVQFPWRLLSLQVLFASLLVGVLAERVRQAHIIAGVAVVLLMGSALDGLCPEWLAIGEGDITPDRLRLYEYFTTNVGTTVRCEYLPQEVETRPYTSAVFLNRGGKPPPLVIEGDAPGRQLLDAGPTWEVWDIEVTSARADLAFHTHYFPGWQATVNGSSHSLSPVEGWGTLGLSLLQGRHRVILRLGRTPLRWAGELISLLSAILALAMAVSAIRRGGRSLPSLALPLLMLTLVALGAVGPRLMSADSPSPRDLSMDLVRQPYLHHNPDGVRFKDEARLLGYDLSSEEVQAGGELVVTLAWRVTADEPVTAIVRLTSPSGPIFANSVPAVERTHRAEVRNDPSGSAESVHRLAVPAGAVPGPYLLSVELRAEGDRVDPVTCQGDALGTTYLRPVWVTEAGRTEPSGEVLATFGERIVLLVAEAERARDRRVDVHLTWQALRPIPANYNLSLRLRDPSGRQVSTRDLQPHYGYYPTSLWSPGVPVRDTLSLDVPKDMPSGRGYTLELILYPVSTLVPVGQGEVGIQISE